MFNETIIFPTGIFFRGRVGCENRRLFSKVRELKFCLNSSVFAFCSPIPSQSLSYVCIFNVATN